MLKLAFLVVFLWISALDCKPNPVLLISFDGFRADKLDEFLKQNPDSNFNKFIQSGVRAKYMKPSFPTLTFPNHWTLVTGQYVESHGVVANVVYFPEYDIKIRLGLTKETRFWNKSEPIWLTAKNQGKKTASSYWVGSEANNRQPDIFLNFADKFDINDRIELLVNWFVKFDLDFACMYFDQPDSDGHSYGPDSNEYKNRVAEMDKVFGQIIKRLTEENLIDNMNIVVVSDHGMAPLDKDFQIPLNEYIDINKIDLNKTVFATVSNIYPKSKDDIDSLVTDMKKIPNLKVFKREDLPSQLYYSKNNRIGPIIAVSEEKYELGEKRENITYLKNGAHGYDNELVSMRAIFLANGPSFKSNFTLEPFQNVNVYSLICKLVEIKCNPSNGTIDVFTSALVSSSSTRTNFNSLIYLIVAFILAFLY